MADILDEREFMAALAELSARVSKDSRIIFFCMGFTKPALVSFCNNSSPAEMVYYARTITKKFTEKVNEDNEKAKDK